jgi:hypothetical protein
MRSLTDPFRPQAAGGQRRLCGRLNDRARRYPIARAPAQQAHQ